MGVNPVMPRFPMLSGIFMHPAMVTDLVQVLLATELPGISIAQPVIRHFVLSAINDFLIEHAVFIADAITVRRQ